MADETKQAEAKVAEKKVKIRTRRAILINRTKGRGGVVEGTIVQAGVEVEVTEAEAKEYCETQFTGHYAFAGERHYGYDNEKRRPIDRDGETYRDAHKMHDYRRAVRVA